MIPPEEEELWKHVGGRSGEAAFAVATANGRVLLQRKRHYPADVYRLPTGRLQPGETAEAALRREVLEETGLVVRRTRDLAVIRFHVDYGGRTSGFETRLFAVETFPGTLSPWIGPRESSGIWPCPLDSSPDTGGGSETFRRRSTPGDASAPRPWPLSGRFFGAAVLQPDGTRRMPEELLPEWIVRLGIALAIGLLIGLQRESVRADGPHRLGGVRTYALVSVAGFVAAYGWPNQPVFLAGLAVLGLLLTAAFVRTGMAGEGWGITAELAAIVTFLLGGMAAAGPHLPPVAIGVLATLLLAAKQPLHAFIREHIGRRK